MYGIILASSLFQLSSRIYDDQIGWPFYFHILSSILLIVLGIRTYMKNYVLLENNTIKIRTEFKTKKIDLSEIDELKHFAGDFILKKQGEELFRVVPQEMKKEVFDKFVDEINKRYNN